MDTSDLEPLPQHLTSRKHLLLPISQDAGDGPEQLANPWGNAELWSLYYFDTEAKSPSESLPFPTSLELIDIIVQVASDQPPGTQFEVGAVDTPAYH